MFHVNLLKTTLEASAATWAFYFIKPLVYQNIINTFMYRVQTASTIRIGSVVFPYNCTNPNEFVAVTSSRLSATMKELQKAVR